MKVAEDQVRLPDGTITDYVLFPDKARSVTILCVVDKKLLVQREYSYPINETMYQLPGGGAHQNESLEEAARRELAEESQYYAKNLAQIGWYYTDNRRTASKMHVFLTTDVSRDTNHASDAEEVIKSEWVPLQDIPKMIQEGNIVNHAMLAGLAILQNNKKY